jgi:diguanylate cyclase (GGDEF)-like protein/PAS domain S-box-containing protein
VVDPEVVAHDVKMIEPAARDAAFADLVVRHPDAYVGAISPAGHFVTPPDGFGAEGLQQIVGVQSALAVVVPGDATIAIDAWHAMLAEGLTSCFVHPAAAPTELVRMHLIDMTHRHGVYATFLIGLRDRPEGISLDHPPIRPRLVKVRKDMGAVIKDIDPEVHLILGWRADELIGTRAIDLVHPDDRGRAIASWVDLMSAPLGDARRVRLRHLHRDGHPVWFEVANHNLLSDPDDPRVIAEMLDISDEMAAQEALRVGEQLLRRLTETIPLGIVQIDADRRIVYQNEQSSMPVHSGDILDDECLSPVEPDDRPALDAALAEVLGTGRDVDVEFGHRAGRGLRRVRANLRSLTAESGEVTGAIICLIDITTDVRLRDELKVRATYDALTGCCNRGSTLTALQDALAGSGRTRGTAVIFIDLNEFKQVNDRYGHAAGDELLTYVAGRLRASVREGDVVGRFGGDEFVVICRDVPGPDRARRIGESLVEALRASHLDVAGDRLLPQASIGVAWGDPETISPHALIARADTAMYAAKHARTGRLALTLAD